MSCAAGQVARGTICQSGIEKKRPSVYAFTGRAKCGTSFRGEIALDDENNARALRIKRAYEPSAPEDGFRVLADRLWPRGVSREKAALDLWAKELAPTAALRTWYGHDAVRFPEFRALYLGELDANPAASAFAARCRKLPEGTPVTIVFAAKDPELSNAAVLREWLAARI